VHTAQVKTSPNNSNQRPDRSGMCVVCQRIYHNPSFTGICPACNQKSGMSTSRPNASMRLQTQNMYVPAYESDDNAVLSPTPNTRNSFVVYCPHCKTPYLLNNVSSNSGYYCGVCRNVIHSTNYH
jgi:hypothetical protein